MSEGWNSEEGYVPLVRRNAQGRVIKGPVIPKGRKIKMPVITNEGYERFFSNPERPFPGTVGPYALELLSNNRTSAAPASEPALEVLPNNTLSAPQASAPALEVLPNNRPSAPQASVPVLEVLPNNTPSAPPSSAPVLEVLPNNRPSAPQASAPVLEPLPRILAPQNVIVTPHARSIISGVSVSQAPPLTQAVQAVSTLPPRAPSRGLASRSAGIAIQPLRPPPINLSGSSVATTSQSVHNPAFPRSPITLSQYWEKEKPSPTLLEKLPTVEYPYGGKRLRAKSRKSRKNKAKKVKAKAKKSRKHLRR